MLLFIGPASPAPGVSLLKGPITAPIVKGPLPGLLAPFVDLLFPSPVSDGTLPPWYQPPVSPSGDPTNPVNIDAPSNPTNPLISDNGTYEITNIVATYRRIRVSTGVVEDPAARYLQQGDGKFTVTGPVFKFMVAEAHGGNDTIPFQYQRTPTGVGLIHLN